MTIIHLYVPQNRGEPPAVDFSGAERSKAQCRCSRSRLYCPRCAPRTYTSYGARHRAEAAQ